MGPRSGDTGLRRGLSNPCEFSLALSRYILLSHGNVSRVLPLPPSDA
jgi:hypothetical protein